MSSSPLAALLVRHWYRSTPSALCRLLWPLSRLYRVLARSDAARRQARAIEMPQPAVPVIVVGNLIAGGAGKTPVVVSVVQALQRAGLQPGVVSRGHGRHSRGIHAVTTTTSPDEVGDEPMLIHRRTGVPVSVGNDRVAAARALCVRHPAVQVIVSDDGLQHRQLARAVEIVVFDERGIGNGCLLPAGPLREPFETAPPDTALVLYNHPAPTTIWPGWCALRSARGAVPLRAWLDGAREPATPLNGLQETAHVPLTAMAGIAAPDRFFALLADHGLRFEALPLPDHHRYTVAPWHADCAGIVTTEKDAVKLAPFASGSMPIWVVPLDLALPEGFTDELINRVRSAMRHEP